ncbi:protein of unknown function [Micropruina glycogenica]|uniref:Uncharacterized protein n=1 Tax=Micropruina glycogenica TaxID=75385 RepID=A0A2N9JBJ3_9ACTN|nr:protein of unknown function [Micropruina glycogenica]
MDQGRAILHLPPIWMWNSGST